MTKIIYIINGPNLNLLGNREPEIYGELTLKDIENKCKKYSENIYLDIIFKQSNIEGEIVNYIQEAGNKASGVIINPAAYTHTSVAIHDALKSLIIPSIEIHLSQPAKRENFRHKSLIAEVVNGTISGFGPNSYLLAMKAIDDLLKTNTES